ncbi:MULTISPECIES: prolyl oligopeptidase family serine peptidase [Vibrio]|uniref:Phospholipase n=1 Tax=Vibrio diazotrophicus TaxID=685 RepID=A0A2J8I0J3_VIBDI|nr:MULTISPECIES: prolyl oligopeptidase family serine peptidase [Vibrio]MCF7364001.1 prolyl oligopeptidase family serine peptidase [Vibrio sp. A1-b2]PNH95959.1 phospholipase [Vibrio diazotrophicus]PNI04057.1 phospholipase [Vibrio diazotrophicus]
MSKLKELCKELENRFSTKFFVYLPKGYNERDEKWPLIISLHGSGERGTDLELLKKEGMPKLIEEGVEFPFVMVFPQCEKFSAWEPDRIKLLVDEIVDTYHVDQSRLYLTGYSLGGYGTWATAIKYPDLFAAIAPICGFAMLGDVARLSKIPVWTFHGENDEVMPYKFTEEIANIINKNGGNAKFTLYSDTGHNCWDEAYKSEDLYNWFTSYKKH